LGQIVIIVLSAVRAIIVGMVIGLSYFRPFGFIGEMIKNKI